LTKSSAKHHLNCLPKPGFPWSEKKGKAQKKKQTQKADIDNNRLQIECDFYAEIANAEGPVSLKSMLSDVSTEFKCLNGGGNVDVDLDEGDYMWMEVAETANSMRSKMYQLERAYRFMSEHDPVCLPKCTVVCLNGESGRFKTIADHVQQC